LGLARHTSPYDKPGAGEFTELNCSLEGQVANIADRIAVSSHDLEDGMRAGLIEEEKLKNVVLFADAQNRVKADTIDDWTVRRTRTAKAIIDNLVSDCVEQSREVIEQAKISNLNDIYKKRESLIVLSEKSDGQLLELERFLLDNFYHHRSLLNTVKQVEQWLKKLFDNLCKKPDSMPHYFQKFIGTQGLQRAVCDYIAGMTDRFCMKTLEAI